MLEWTFLLFLVWSVDQTSDTYRKKRKRKAIWLHGYFWKNTWHICHTLYWFKKSNSNVIRNILSSYFSSLVNYWVVGVFFWVIYILSFLFILNFLCLYAGHIKQGLRCRACKANAHVDCAPLLPKCQAKPKVLRRQKSTSEIVNRVDIDDSK